MFQVFLRNDLQQSSFEYVENIVFIGFERFFACPMECVFEMASLKKQLKTKENQYFQARGGGIGRLGRLDDDD